MTSSEHPGGSRQGAPSVPLRPELVRVAGDRGAQQQTSRPIALVVAGMHRSGTSAVTRALALCGLELPRTLMPGNAFNEDGHWESEVVKVGNDAILRELDSAWDDALAVRASRKGRLPRASLESIKAAIRDQFPLDRDVVIKDPRISLLFPSWRDALQDLGFDVRLVVPVRHPLEVIASLSRRDGFPPIKSALLWLTHFIALERDSRGTPRVFTSYDDLLTDWRQCLKRIERVTGARLPRWNDAAELEIDRFLSHDRRHHRYSMEDLESRSDLPSWVADTYRWALAAARDDEEPSQSALTAIAESFSATAETYAPLVSFERRKSERAVPPLGAGPTQHVMVSLYYGTPAAPYSETTSIHRDVELAGAPRVVEFRTPALNPPVSMLRLDPAEGRGSLRMLALRLLSQNGEVLWQWDGKADLFDHALGISAHETPDGKLLLDFTNDDPQIELPVASVLAGRANISVELTIARTEEADHALLREIARDARLEQLSQRLDTVVEKLGGANIQQQIEANSQALLSQITTLLEAQSKLITEQSQAARRSVLPDIARAVELAGRAERSTGQTKATLEASLSRISAELGEQRRAIAQQGEDFARGLQQERSARNQQAQQEKDQRAAQEHRYRQSEQQLRSEVASAAQTAKRWQEEAAALRASTSWVITAPLRAFRNLPGSLVAGAKNVARPVRDQAVRAVKGAPKPLPPVAAPEPGSDAALLAHSSLFDPVWYLAEFPDVAAAGVDPLQHYLHYGAFEGRAPGPWFDSKWYLAQNPDVQAAGANPLVHYLRAGRREKREPLPPHAQTKRSLGAHMSMLGSRRHRTYVTSALALKFEGAMPAGLARKFRRRLHINAPAPLPPREVEGSVLFDQLFSTAVARSDEYVPLAQTGDAFTSRVKTIAFYLPQFHPIPENDAWWGKGFTEWTNVSKAVPQFVGHYQPRLPDELGFYDLRVVDVQRRQAELAKQYGLGGFCFHYYWFTGRKRLLERPLNQYLGAQDIDFPFCICWANENWTRRWDGLDQQILMEQRHEPADDLAFIEDLAPVLRDRRYIRVNGRPLIIVYRAGILPNPQRTTQVWRDYCRSNGLGDPYIVAAQTFGLEDPRPLGFDAAVEFPPHKVSTAEIQNSQELLNTSFEGRVFSYEAVAKQESKINWPAYTVFKTVMPSWDNEARKPGKGHVFTGATPEIYKDWLSAVCRETDEKREGDEKLVFVNAWNEWAEGAYLEPDRRFGYAYLQATRDVLSAYGDAAPVASHNPWPPLYIIAHAYYTEVFGELLNYLRDAPAQFHLVVTCPPDRTAKVREAFEASGLSCPFEIVEVENRGRDVLAFLEALRRTYIPDDAVVLKVHTKVTSHRIDGSDWRRAMLDSLMLPNVMSNVLNAFSTHAQLNLIAPGGYIVPLKTFIGENQPHLDALLRRGGWEPIKSDQDVFAAGTMFYIRRRSLDALLKLGLERGVFEEEAGQKDGTVAHALERLITMVVMREGGEITDTQALLECRQWTANADFDFAVKTAYLYRDN